MIAALLASLVSLRLGETTLGETTPSVLEGDPLNLRITGLRKGEKVLLHSFRTLSKWNGQAYVDVPMHAWAEFRTSGEGIDVDRMKPLRGSWRRAGSLALLWSAYPAADPTTPEWARRVQVDAPKDGSVALVVERDGESLARGTFRLRNGLPGMTLETVSLPGLNGVFAYPKGARGLPVVIGLHGSEGGSVAGAQGRASSFASRGFATFALNYFAYPYQAIPGLATSHDQIPVETILRAREWLSKRSEADVNRLGLYGVSKGAEFAAVAASNYDWIKGVVAVVPSDVVWEGYKGEGGESGNSSWSLNGQPLPYIPLYGIDPRFRTNTDRYENSRRDRRKEAKAAEIPVERSKARFLFVGSERDEVWASGKMTRRLASRLPKDRATAVVFPKAGHQIAGLGAFPTRLYGVPSKDPRGKDLTSEGEAAEETWRRTGAFFRQVL